MFLASNGWAAAPGDWASVAGSSRAIEAERFRGAYADMVPLASELLRAADEQPNPEQSARLISLAAEAAPGDPRPHARLAKLAALKMHSPALALRETLSAAMAVARDPWFQVIFPLRLLSWLWVASALAGLALLAAALPSFGPLCFHDYSDAFPRGIRRYTPVAFAALALATLWGAGVGPFAIATLVGLLVAGYLPQGRRWALGGCLTLTALLFLGVEWLSAATGPSGERAWALYCVEKGASGPDVEAAVATHFPGSQSSSLSARALLARRAGRYEASAEHLRAALAAGADEASVRLELGNLFFLRGRLQEAFAEYERAAACKPQAPEPWINQHVVHLKRLELAEADAALARARALDPKAVESFQRGAATGFEGLWPVFLPLSAGGVRAELMAALPQAAPWAKQLFGALFVPIAHLTPIPLALFALVGSGVAGLGDKGRRSHRCRACGTTVCPRCSRRVKGTDLCPACWSLSNQKHVDSGERERQESAARRWEAKARRQRRLGKALLPGWSDFAHDGSPKSLAVGILWSLALGAVALYGLQPGSTLPGTRGSFPWVWGVVFLLTQLVGVRSALVQPLGGAGAHRRK